MSGQMRAVKDYISLLRIDHWFKNVFMIAGILAALILLEDARSWSIIPDVVIGIFATCLIASANYVINEILDASTDRNHPTKRCRPIPAGRIRIPVAYIEYIIVAIAGLAIAATLGFHFFMSALALLIMGIIYNVRPIRSKEIPCIDVLSESINNPIRLLLGWYTTGVEGFPPSSLVVSYWMFGAFLMASKRLAEYRKIGDKKAATYRRSFSFYNEERLVMSLVAYASGFMFFFAVILIKYHVELILSAPFLMFYLAYYIKLTYESNSIVQTPELLLRNPFFILINLATLILLILLSTAQIPVLQKLLGFS